MAGPAVSPSEDSYRKGLALLERRNYKDAILLFRSAKRSAVFLGWLAAALLAMHVIDVYWLVAPSVRPLGFHISVFDLLALAAAAALWWFAWRPAHARA